MNPMNPVARARELQRAIVVEGSDADVARAFGMTRAGICQYLTLVRRLPADLLDAVAAETDPRLVRRLSLRRILQAAAVGKDEARRRFLEELLQGDR
jgi:DNA-directed RNA polymerase sigma subunit (sigma70/sigma32)